jgi:DNA polymerase III delta subunit
MLYVFHGTDTHLVRTKAFARAHECASREHKEITRVYGDACDTSYLLSLAEGVSLFGGNEVILIDTPRKDEEDGEALRSSLVAFAESPNHIIIIEGKLTAAEKKMYTAHAAECVACEGSEKTQSYNVFQFTDALLERDKKKAWMQLVASDGVPHEEIVGVLFWQLKIMRIAAMTTDSGETDIKPFVYAKAKRALSKYTLSELDRMSQELLELYHDAHGGKRDMAWGLERWLLSL